MQINTLKKMFYTKSLPHSKPWKSIWNLAPMWCSHLVNIFPKVVQWKEEWFGIRAALHPVQALPLTDKCLNPWEPILSGHRQACCCLLFSFLSSLSAVITFYIIMSLLSSTAQFYTQSSCQRADHLFYRIKSTDFTAWILWKISITQRTLFFYYHF